MLSDSILQNNSLPCISSIILTNFHNDKLKPIQSIFEGLDNIRAIVFGFYREKGSPSTLFESYKFTIKEKALQIRVCFTEISDLDVV